MFVFVSLRQGTSALGLSAGQYLFPGGECDVCHAGPGWRGRESDERRRPSASADQRQPLRALCHLARRLHLQDR